MKNSSCYALVLAVLLSLTARCSGTGRNSADAPTADVSADETEGGETHAVTSATPGVASVVLTPSHSGWAMASCMECHTAWHGGHKAPDCIVCHGRNGAPDRPAEHASGGCDNCHADPHAEQKPVAPGDCTACHKFATTGDCPQTIKTDVVVIGAGGGGLAAAATLSGAGLDVVVLERHNKPGGCMTNFKRGDYRFEASLHAMGGLDDQNGSTAAMMKELGIWKDVKPVKTEWMYKAVYPDAQFAVHEDVDGYLAELQAAFPQESENLDAMFTHWQGDMDLLLLALAYIDGDESAMEEALAKDPDGVMRLLGYLDETLAVVMDRYIQDPMLKSVVSQLCSYAGGEPSRISSLFFLMMWNSYHRDGFYYFQGGSQSISDALAAVIAENGSQVRLNTEVTNIVVENGRAVRVETAGDLCYEPDWIVSNANLPATIELIGRENLPAEYLEPVDAMTSGLPATVVYLGLDADFTPLFDKGHEIILQDSPDTDAIFAAGYECRPEDGLLLLIANYSLLDPTAAPPGHNVVTLTGLLSFDCFKDSWGDHESYKEAKDAYARLFIERAEELLPGLSQHIEVMEVAVPQTTWAFTGNPGGSFIGYDATPEQSILNRPAQETPVENLFLAGAWTFPGGGQSTVLQSGQMAAQKILALKAKR